MRGDWIMDGGMGIWMVMNVAFWVLVLIGIVLLVIWVVRMVGKGNRGTVEGSALEILKKRYARGEITKEEFEEIKRDIA